MIPVRLHLRNFMAYRQTDPLDFSEFHIACLSGENGAGKSTLLDAITWTLWGKARVRSDDDLMHLGESEMETEFTFELNNETYRVLRRRSRSGRGKSELHFHVFDAGGWRTLTENSIRLSQDKINRLLRLDYDTFINSAFLLQGRADEFTAKKPAERKQILSDILGLGIYDEYVERSRKIARHHRESAREIEGQLKQIEADLAHEAQHRQSLRESQSQIAELSRRQTEAEQRFDQLRQQVLQLNHKRSQLQELEARLQESGQEIAALQQDLAQSESRLNTYRQILNRATEIDTGYQQLQAAQTEVEQWNNRLGESSRLSAEKHRLEQEFAAARSKIEQKIGVLEARYRELQQRSANLPQLEQTVQQLAAEVAAVETDQASRDAEQQTLKELSGEQGRLEQENRQLKEEMGIIRVRLDQLQAADAICPVCTQPLTDEHRRHVEQEFTAQGTSKGDAFRANQAQMQALQQTRQASEQRLQQLEKRLRQASQVQRRYATQQKVLDDARQAQNELPDIEQALAAHRQTLTNAAFAVDVQHKLETLREQLVAVGYDDIAHDAARQQIKKLSHFNADQRELAQAQQQLPEEESRHQRDQERLTRLQQQTQSDRETLETLRAETATLPALQQELAAANQSVEQLEQGLREARNREAAAQQMLNHIAEQGRKRGELETRLMQVKETTGLYEELITAFGKRGVQALLIEHAIPELEDEANTILARMTDGRMHLQFITQKTTKVSENTIETLDIRIADEIGTRDYELYSGGEAFRVNFAIRIALSKLLARRSGSRLQTLVIDEGFGTQDAQGRERLVEAINKIQDEFEKILVITHIDELKDAFPKRINVYKTSDGSRISA